MAARLQSEIVCGTFRSVGLSERTASSPGSIQRRGGGADANRYQPEHGSGRTPGRTGEIRGGVAGEPSAGSDWTLGCTGGWTWR